MATKENPYHHRRDRLTQGDDMNKNERKALELWKINQSNDIANMTTQQLYLQIKQQDRLYRYAHKRIDKKILGKY